MTTVLVADDHAEIRAALVRLIDAEPGLRLVGTANDAQGAIALAAREHPDVALVDVRMPGGGALAAREIALGSPQTKVVALSAHEDRASIFEMLAAGAAGYLVKGGDAAEIVATIERVARGDGALSSEVTGEVVRELGAQLRQRHESEEEVRRRIALIRRVGRPGSIAIAFQPIVQLSSLRSIGFEALARFAAPPDRPPDAWFAEAETVGLRPELELATVRAALPSAHRLPSDAFVSINISPDVVVSPGMLERVNSASSQVVSEMTEQRPVEDYDRVREALEAFRARGGRVAVDDAGAGFASLTHILKLQPDIVKIDRSLVGSVESDRGARALVSGLLAFTDEMQQLLVAEGVERTSTRETLLDIGVRYGQGYLFGRPTVTDTLGR